MADEAVVLLHRARQEAGHVHEGDEGDAKSVAKADEARRFDRRVNVEAAGKLERLVCNHAHATALHARKARDDVARVVGLDLLDVPVVYHLLDDGAHVVGRVGIVGDYEVEAAQVVAIAAVERGQHLGALAVRLGQVGDEAAHARHGLELVVEGAVAHARDAGVGLCAAQGLGRYLLVGDCLDHLGASHKHVGRVTHHVGEVRQRRGVDGATRAGPHDHRDLGDDPRGVHVALENLAIAAEGRDPLLDAGAPRVVEADEGRADEHGAVHHLADLLRLGLGERPAEHREVLGAGEDRAAVDLTLACDDAVARKALLVHAKVHAPVGLDHVRLAEGARIEEHAQPLPRGQLAAGVLHRHALRAAALERLALEVADALAGDLLDAGRLVLDRRRIEVFVPVVKTLGHRGHAALRDRSLGRGCVRGRGERADGRGALVRPPADAHGAGARLGLGCLLHERVHHAEGLQGAHLRELPRAGGHGARE
mmetsp:Transcript_19341/g.57038  ORF Transcript_19341/g.57038 Transcript_19341/m.57038 type:complete len:481 (-) Transcript_19341:38-1480(-)